MLISFTSCVPVRTLLINLTLAHNDSYICAKCVVRNYVSDTMQPYFIMRSVTVLQKARGPRLANPYSRNTLHYTGRDGSKVDRKKASRSFLIREAQRSFPPYATVRSNVYGQSSDTKTDNKIR